MEIASTFLALAISIDLPLAIVAIIFHAKKIKPSNAILLFFNIFAFALILGAIINSIVAMAMYSAPYSYYDSYSRTYRYYQADIHECTWVAMGLSLGGLVVSLAVMLITLDCVRRIRRARKQQIYYSKLNAQKAAQHTASLASKQTPQPEAAPEKPVNHSMDYIDEIKRLKELLDCGAITQEEFDAKKKQLLS